MMRSNRETVQDMVPKLEMDQLVEQLREEQREMAGVVSGLGEAMGGPLGYTTRRRRYIRAIWALIVAQAVSVVAIAWLLASRPSYPEVEQMLRSRDAGP